MNKLTSQREARELADAVNRAFDKKSRDGHKLALDIMAELVRNGTKDEFQKHFIRCLKFRP